MKDFWKELPFAVKLIMAVITIVISYTVGVKRVVIKSGIIDANAEAIAKVEKKLETKADCVLTDLRISKIEESTRDIKNNVDALSGKLEGFQLETRQDFKNFQKQIIEILKDQYRSGHGNTATSSTQ